MLSGEAANTNFIVWFDPTVIWTHDLSHSRQTNYPLYTTDLVTISR